MQFLKRIFDVSLLKFLLIGLMNTLLSLGITFALYDWAGLGYWGATATAYVATSVLAFVLNRRFTFRSRETLWKSAVKFAVVIGVCYVIAYSLAKPLAIAAGQRWMPGLAQDMVEKVALLVGQVLFTSMNYLGQKFFAFRKQGG
ncbi:MAG: GtrA family protein [Eubacteriales bacterium]|nr:GtrA family protein [Eubacteriales bacterium]